MVVESINPVDYTWNIKRTNPELSRLVQLSNRDTSLSFDPPADNTEEIKVYGTAISGNKPINFTIMPYSLPNVNISSLYEFYVGIANSQTNPAASEGFLVQVHGGKACTYHNAVDIEDFMTHGIQFMFRNGKILVRLGGVMSGATRQLNPDDIDDYRLSTYYPFVVFSGQFHMDPHSLTIVSSSVI